MTKKIVSGVSRFQQKHPESGELVDRVRVHYTDGSTKEFNVVEILQAIPDNKTQI